MTPNTALPSQTVEEIVDRAGRPDFERWAEQVARCGHCSRPVRLRGRVEHRSADSRRVVYSTDSEPDRTLLIRCGNRRAAVCPSCSYEYAGDMWQLLYAGAAGGRKGVPESIRSHPLVFATLTAPGFGPVHTTRTDRFARSARCRPAHGKPRLCPHGRPTWCTAIHTEDDPGLGQPFARTATTTPLTSRSTGMPPSCGGGSLLPCVAAWLGPPALPRLSSRSAAGSRLSRSRNFNGAVWSTSTR
jgi:hypothetical protein